MPEFPHDSTDDGFHEIQLSGKQLVFLFIVTTMALVTTFLFGVYVGRGAGGAPSVETSADAPAVAEPAPQSQTPAQAAPIEPPPDAVGEDPGPVSGETAATGTAAPESTPPSAPPAKPEPAPPARPAVAAGEVPTAARPGTHVVQVAAFKDRNAAAEVVKRLVAKGYPAFLVDPTSRNVPQFYKVQVGKYAERREAEQVVRRIAKEEKFKPWISR